MYLSVSSQEVINTGYMPCDRDTLSLLELSGKRSGDMEFSRGNLANWRKTNNFASN